MKFLISKIQSKSQSAAYLSGLLLSLLIVAAFAPKNSYAQEVETLSIGRILGVNFLPTYIMESQNLIEKHAKTLGIDKLKVDWKTFSGGGGATDAMLSGSINVVDAGASNLLLLWDRTRGGVKGIVSHAALPAALISTDPKLKSLKDYGPSDKIALPTVGVSAQAILLQMQSAKVFGPSQWKKMDSNTVQMGHADAMVALSNPNGEVKSHFASPPFITRELKDLPGAHIVISLQEIVGSSVSTSVLFSTTKFGNANPKLLQAIRMASEDAINFINKNPKQAAEAYTTITHDRTSIDDLTALISLPDMKYSIVPEGTMKFAEHLFRVGVIKTEPKAWTDYFLAVASDLSGS